MPDKAGRGAAERAADAARIRALEFALRAAASPIDPALDLPAKPMFSGASVYVAGKRMAARHGLRLALKLSLEARPDDPALLSSWVNSALTYTPRTPRR